MTTFGNAAPQASADGLIEALNASTGLLVEMLDKGNGRKALEQVKANAAAIQAYRDVINGPKIAALEARMEALESGAN